MVMARMITVCAGNAVFTIAASVRSPDIAALARSAGWNGSGRIVCTINASVEVATLNITGIPHDCLTIINKGRIGGVINGGTGLYTRTRIRIDNSAGTIFGGGGLGGQGQSVTIFRGTGYTATGSGGAGGNGAGFNTSGTPVMQGVVAGASGTSQTVGGPSIGGTTQGTATGGTGGTGGAIGVAGQVGGTASASGTYESINYTPPTPAVGAAAGAYLDGSSYVTWIANGSRLGNAIN